MEKEYFEGTLVLEKLAAVGLVEAFLEAVDADNFGAATRLMKRAGLDAETIGMVLKQMAEGA